MNTISKRTLLQLLAGSHFLAGASAESAPPPIDWNDLQQTMDGFGASASFHQAHNLQGFAKEAQAEVLDLLFSTDKGAGLSITRNIVGDGGVIEDGSQWGKPFNGPTPSIEPEKGKWNWKGDEEQVWFMREAQKRGCARHLSTVWSPPYWMKENKSVIHGSTVTPEHYRDFAEYLSAYVRGYKKHHGIDIYAISPTNEPDISQTYSSCLWSGEQLRVLVRDHITPVFAHDRVNAKLVLGESCYWREDPYALSLSDSAAAPRVDICAAHAYTYRGKEAIPYRSGPLPLTRAAGKPIWQTEVSTAAKNDPSIDDGLFWAQMLHTHVVDDQASAWFFWWAIAYGNGLGSLINMDLERKTFSVSKRLFTLGNYARFVRPGMKRVASRSQPEPDVYLAAFKDDKTAVAVLINKNTRDTQLSFPAPGAAATCWRTSATEDLAAAGALRASDGKFTAVLAPRSVTSVVVKL